MTELNPHMEAIQRRFARSLSELMAAWLDDYADQHPTSGLHVADTLRGGGFVTISASSAPLTQTQSCVLTVTDIKGNVSELCSMSFGG